MPYPRASTGWRVFFGVAAAFNLMVAAAGFAGASIGVDQLVISLLVGCFGIVYLLVARDPYRFAPILWAGVIGKFGVVALMGPAAFATGDPVVGPVLVCDALFALGFLLFLLRKPAS